MISYRELEIIHSVLRKHKPCDDDGLSMVCCYECLMDQILEKLNES